MSKWSSEEQRTIKQLADSARRNGRNQYGDAEWAKMCLEFNHQFSEGDNDYVRRYVSIMRFLAEYPSAANMQLGAVWLDGHDFGNRSIEWMAGELTRIRQGLK